MVIYECCYVVYFIGDDELEVIVCDVFFDFGE